MSESNAMEFEVLDLFHERVEQWFKEPGREQMYQRGNLSNRTRIVGFRVQLAAMVAEGWQIVAFNGCTYGETSSPSNLFVLLQREARK
jgi:hypothetical protein